MSLGGEIFPLTWARALESVRTAPPVPGRARSLRFPRGSRAIADHLPIGLTAAAEEARRVGADARDQLRGLPCDELIHAGATYRIDGAPNVLMDIIEFNGDLARSVRRIAEHPGDFAAFQLRVVGSPEEAARLKATSPDVLQVLEALAAWDRKDGADQMADALATALTPLFAAGEVELAAGRQHHGDAVARAAGDPGVHLATASHRRGGGPDDRRVPPGELGPGRPARRARSRPDRRGPEARWR